MLAKITSAQVIGLDVLDIEIETDISRGTNSFSIIGLPDKAIEEAKDRIVTAINNSKIKLPQTGGRKIVVSLAPADLKKEGPIFDLPIAVAHLLALGVISFETKGKLFIGELGLSGELRPIKGALKIASHAKKRGIKEIYLPYQNSKEAALVSEVAIFGCKTLLELARHLNEKPKEQFPRIEILRQKTTKLSVSEELPEDIVDFKDIAGQESVKRALEIAAAGGHNVAMFGPPGTGKTLMAKAMPGILPPLSFEQTLEVTGIHSVVGTNSGKIITRAPFRSPHHTASHIAIVGGGAEPKPGEITLAHRGILFMDEFPEFEKRVIEALRQPLEDKKINVARARNNALFPADFILVAALNPCPCGNLGLETKECICNQGSIQKYQRKISGPIIDRIDIWINVPQIDYEKLLNGTGREDSKSVRQRVINARIIQAERLNSDRLNGQMGVKEIKEKIVLSKGLVAILNRSARELDLSPRSYHKVIKLARTIADLDNKKYIEESHLYEALQYRPKTNF